MFLCHAILEVPATRGIEDIGRMSKYRIQGSVNLGYRALFFECTH